MPDRPAVDRTRPTIRILRYVWRDVHRPRLLDEIVRVLERGLHVNVAWVQRTKGDRQRYGYDLCGGYWVVRGPILAGRGKSGCGITSAAYSLPGTQPELSTATT